MVVCLCNSFVATSFAADPAAKTASSSGTIMLGTVNVTAEKRDEQANDVPISLDVKTSDDLQRNQLFSTPDVISSSVNASFGGGTTGAAYTPYVAIRGVGSAEIDSDPSIGLFVDGLPMTDLQSYTSGLLDVEQVEILRGPQGTLYGRNTLGGSINVNTNKPDPSTVSGRVQVDAGTRGQVRTELVGNAPINTGESAIRFAFAFDNDPGYIENKNANGTDAGAHENYQGRIGVLTSLNDSTVLQLSVDGQQQSLRDGGVQYLSEYEAGRDTVNVEDNFHGKLKSMGARAELTHDLPSGALLTSLTGVRHQETNYSGQVGPSSYFDATNTQLRGFGVTNYRHRTDNPYDSDFDQISQEFRYTSPEGEALKYVVGVYGEASSTNRVYGIESQWDNNVLLTGNGVAISMESNTDSQSLAAFGDGSYQINEDWEAFGGLRIGLDHKDFDYTMTSTNASYMALLFTGTSALLDSYQGSMTKAYTTPRAGVRYIIDDGNNIYTSVSQGYKSGGFNASTLFANGSTPVEYKSEHLTNYELGMKNSLFGGKLSLASALFFIDWRNQQVLTYDATTAASPIVNASSSRSYGAEVSGNADLGDGWSVSAAVGYSDATYEKFQSAPLTGGGGSFDASGNDQQYHSKFTGNVAVGYSWDLNIDDLKASANLGYNYRSSFYFDVQNTLKQDGYGTVEARIGAENDRYGLYVWGHNLTDERYLTSAVNYGAGALAGQGESLAIGMTGTAKF